MKFSVSVVAATLFLESALATPGDEKRLQSKQLRHAILRSNLLKHADALVEHARLSNGSRAFGSKGHNATVDYIKRKLDATGYYDTELQTFVYPFSDGTANFTAKEKKYSTEWFTYGPAGNVTAPVVVVNELGCEKANFLATVEGNIALIKRGSCEFGLKIALAGAAGASGAIIYNNADGPIGGGTLIKPSRPDVGPYVPAGSISGVDGVALIASIASGEVVGNIYVDATNEDRYTSNVLATTKLGDKKNVIMAGGHTDSVPAGPGINDDGSGSMGLLEIALQLPKWSVKNAVRFGFWTAEEYGLVGSEHWVVSLTAEQISDIALYLNADMIASPNFGYFIYDGDGNAFNITGPAGSDHIEHLFESYFKDAGLVSAPTEFDGRSDYGPFLDAGVPSGGLFTGAEGLKTEQQAKWWGGSAGVAYDPNYHQAGDVKSNLNVGAWIQCTKGFAHAIATYANDLKGIPRGGKRDAAKKRQISHDRRRNSACNHKLHGL
ncbi:hypothetical protein FN846DRAFT_773832 [Sphaerosporella brunnea]|uniref:Peptide hydrolase n=1 Tax=Sphaerosporella brunnea TaxID=1250544 RepID=A0A5J5F4S2_9PEZI|nr:hypothetical protein FN846DRAFT_773832 [Sphaerosporella brunnea]